MEVEYRATIRSLEDLSRRLDDAARELVDESTALVTRLAMENASTGEHAPGLPHIPGTGPGPNVARGTLRRGIKPTPTRRSLDGWEGSAAPTAVYSRAIELGHPAWRPGLKFPFFVPAVQEWRRRSAEMARDIMNRAVHRG